MIDLSNETLRSDTSKLSDFLPDTVMSCKTAHLAVLVIIHEFAAIHDLLLPSQHQFLNQPKQALLSHVLCGKRACVVAWLRETVVRWLPTAWLRKPACTLFTARQVVD